MIDLRYCPASVEGACDSCLKWSQYCIVRWAGVTRSLTCRACHLSNHLAESSTPVDASGDGPGCAPSARSGPPLSLTPFPLGDGDAIGSDSSPLPVAVSRAHDQRSTP